MAKLWRTIRGYIWWTQARGSFHYDVMVTLILLFIFLAPHWVNFKDKPVERTPHQSRVVVSPDGNLVMYEVDASAVQAGSDESVQQSLLRVIEPIAGEVEIVRFEPVKDGSGRIIIYKAWVQR